MICYEGRARAAVGDCGQSKSSKVTGSLQPRPFVTEVTESIKRILPGCALRKQEERKQMSE